MMNLTKDDLAGVKAETLKEILRQSESYLAAQLTAGVAADQRAMSFVSLMAAATVVVAGAGGALLIGEKPLHRLGWTCIAIAVAFVVAIGLAMTSARPVAFRYPGSRAEDWVDDVKSGLSSEASDLEQAVNYNDRIRANVKTLNGNARWMQGALWSVLFGLAGGGAVSIYFLVQL